MTYSNEANQVTYPFILPELPFSKESFNPHFTAETFDYHHGKHHQAYITNLNNLLQNKPELTGKNLEEIIQISHQDSSMAGIFNNAAQVWNHSFFWHSIKPNGGGKPDEELLDQINNDFGGFEKFIEEFKAAAVGQFGSGWAWLVLNDTKLKIIKTSNAETPITEGLQPLLACDVWEHAYYIDYRNKRPDYISTFLEHMINWDFAMLNFKK